MHLGAGGLGASECGYSAKEDAVGGIDAALEEDVGRVGAAVGFGGPVFLFDVVGVEIVQFLVEDAGFDGAEAAQFPLAINEDVH